MQFRSLLFLGFGASLFVNAAAFAAQPVPTAPASDESAVVQVATKAEEEALKKKKKAAAAAKAKSNSKIAAKPAKPQTAAEKQAAKALADKEKAEKAKLAAAKAEKAKLAKAKAEKEKQLAKAKAEKDKLLAAAKAERDKKLALAKAEKEKQAAAAKVERDKKLALAKVEKEKKAAAAKIEREKLMAERAKAAEERKIRLAKEAEERKIARAKAAEERKIKMAQAAEERRLAAEAKAKAAEEVRLAKIRAEQERQAQIAAAAEAARQAEIARLVSMEIVQTGNNNELRSEAAVQAPKQTGLFAGLFGGQAVQKQALLPETRALDAALELKESKKPFKVKPEYMPTTVQYSGYPRGTIVIDTAAHYLYLMEGTNKARRYAIAVGKDGLQYKGAVKVGDKQEWPRWIPTKEMQQREPAKYGQYAEGMPGGGQNPLGARAIYLYENGKDTHLRIHGTIAPETIGTDSSNGCFRMINDHVIDLYRRVPVGTQVVVL